MASEMTHFKNISYVKGDIKVDISLDRFSEQFEKAQQWLGDRVLEDCKAKMPFSTGGMQQRSYSGKTQHMRDASKTEDGGKLVVFPGPYARFQYGGLVMVDPVTGSPWSKRPGKVLTDRKLTYSSPTATDHWFDAAKAENGEYWVAGVKRIAGGG